jgi:RNA polymerase sigma-70 factor, ECF subfamily
MTSRPAQPIGSAKPGPIAMTSPVHASPASESLASESTGAMQFPASLAAAVERCWCKAAAPGEWHLTRDEFQAALEISVSRRFSGAAADPSPINQTSDQKFGQKLDLKKVEAYLDSLHASDLALALACGAGNPAAWDRFMAEFRPEMYRAARAIVGYAAGKDVDARDLADSLYADLYGLRETAGRRKSLFEYFHGRSKLGTWLRAVLAQRHVDEIRRAQRHEPLEDESGEIHIELRRESATRGASAAPPLDPERANDLAILQAALGAALTSLDPRDRLRLAYYYVDDRTLAEIGRLLDEHEATASRKLDRTRRDVRAQVEASLRDGKKWSEAQVRQCLECASGEWPFDLSAHLEPQRKI